MANAKECDICGDLYRIQEMTAIGAMMDNIKYQFEPSYKRVIRVVCKELDMCPKCYNKLVKWFEDNEGVGV